ncbi:MAG: hypothetical protein H6656_00340 [Ardenticatenaceae bacterium]|nr:hypothetical protein [Anaerolineales bacterium]MCB9005832.1 hypothetical protein [Ardenticatenaceae bacterium]
MEQKQDESAEVWRLDSYLELAFDGLTGSEYWTPVPCAYNVETEEKLTLAELIPLLNNWRGGRMKNEPVIRPVWSSS